jgi:raffinose/stachyose/melibiose transport system permease protein
MVLPGLILFLVFFILPFFIGFYYSFTNWDFKRAEFVGLENYIAILKDENMSIAIKNTLLFTVVTTIGKVFFGLCLAIFLNRQSRIVNYMRTVFYLPAVINSIAVGIVFKSIMHPSKGILNTFLNAIGLGALAQNWLTDTKIAMLSICGVEIWKWSGYTMMILLAGMQNISTDYYEAAVLDGASGWQKFRYVTLPLLMPSMNNVIILSMIGGLKVFDIVLAMTGGGPGYATQVLNTMIYRSYSYQKYGQATAGTTLLAAVVLVITLFTYNTISKKEVEM